MCFANGNFGDDATNCLTNDSRCIFEDSADPSKPNTIVLETAYEMAHGGGGGEDDLKKATLSITRNRSNGDIALNGEVLPDWRDPVRGLPNNNQLWPEGSPSTPSQPNNAYTPALNGIVHDINQVLKHEPITHSP